MEAAVKKLNDIAILEAEEKRKNEILVELSKQICNVDKQIKDLSVENQMFEKQLAQMKLNSARTEVELQVLKNRECSFIEDIRKMMMQLHEDQQKLETKQRAVWNVAEDFVSRVNSVVSASNTAPGKTAMKDKLLQEQEQQQIKHQEIQFRAELNVMNMFERFQQGKIEEFNQAVVNMKAHLSATTAEQSQSSMVM